MIYKLKNEFNLLYYYISINFIFLPGIEFKVM